jgi:WD40 repeat protein
MSQPRPTEAGKASAEQDTPDTDSTLTLHPVREHPGPAEVPGIGTAPTLCSPHAAGAATASGGTLPVVEPGRYAIAGELAHGGIGRILRARDTRLDRPVAIKELLAPGSGAEPRFVAEALVTARLQHPSIVPVYEAGRWPGGEPFYAMKLVSGRSLADVISEKKTLAERLALLPHVLAVAEAMAYAHSERIIHRDLKPANVLVGEFGETVVIDWGLAKDLSRAESLLPGAAPGPTATTEDGERTRVGTVMGTPAYMPPEQAAGQPVDERADVYALGAILYHLLAGTRPYTANTSEQVLHHVVRGPPPPLAERQKGLPVDLLAIVTKAMARTPAERYATARELAEDLRRFQTGKIVGAYRYSRMELLRRFVRRYRAAVMVTGVALVLLAGLSAVSIRRILAERDLAHAARQQAQARTDELLLARAREAVEREPNAAITSLQRLSPGFNRWSAARTIAADARAHGFASVQQGHSRALNALFFTRDGTRLVSTSDDHTLIVRDLEHGQSRVLSGHTDEAWRLVLLPDDRSLISSGKDGTLRRWDLETGEGRLFATLSGPVSALALSRDGRHLLAGSRTDELLHVWDLLTGESRTLPTGLKGIDDVKLSPEGRYVFVRGPQGTGTTLGDLERGTFRPLTEEAQVVWVSAFSPSGELFTGSGQGRLYVWDPRSGKGRMLEEGTRPLTALTVVPESGHLLLGYMDGTVRLWNVATGQAKVLGSHEGLVTDLQVSPDGRYVASGSADRTARLWNLATHDFRILRGAEERVFPLDFSPDGRRLALASSDGRVRLFSLEAETHQVLLELKATQRALALSPDGRRLALLSSAGRLHLFDMTTGPTVLLDALGFATGPMDFSPDSRWLAAGGYDGRTHLWEATTGRGERILEGPASPLSALRFSGDGRWLARAHANGEVHLWELASGKGRRLGGHGKYVFQLAFSPDSGQLASAGADGTVRLWDVGSGESRVLRAHTDAVRTVAFSPDGKRLVSGGMDHTLAFWDLETGRSQQQAVSGSGLLELVFSPDGKRLASRSMNEGQVMLWDGRTGESRGVLRGHQGLLIDLAFSPDGTRLASTSTDKTVRLWDLASGEGRVLRGHTGQVGSVAFLPDGRSLLSTGEDGSVRLWPDDLPSEPEALRAWMKNVTGGEPESNVVWR